MVRLLLVMPEELKRTGIVRKLAAGRTEPPDGMTVVFKTTVVIVPLKAFQAWWRLSHRSRIHAALVDLS